MWDAVVSVGGDGVKLCSEEQWVAFSAVSVSKDLWTGYIVVLCALGCEA